MKTDKRQLRKERQRARQAVLDSKEADDGLPPEVLMVEEQDEKEVGEKCEQPSFVTPLGGATSWEELDSYMAAQETSGELSDLNWQFQSMVGNALGSEMVTDKAKAVAALAAGLQKRVGQTASGQSKSTDKELAEKATVTKSEADGDHPASHYLVVEDPEKPTTWHLRVMGMDGKPDHRLMGAAMASLTGGYRGQKYEGPNKTEAMDKLKAMYKAEDMQMPSGKSIADRLTDWLSEKAIEIAKAFEQAPELEALDAPATLTALKSANGKPMLLLHTTNAFKDRDREIFMDAALKDYAAQAQPGTPVDYWHTAWQPGRVTWTGYSEKALFELVEANDDKASQELVEVIAKDPAYWGCSHRFFYAPKERALGVFTALNKTRSTILPIQAAANPYTAIGVLTKEVPMDPKKLDELKGKLSPEAFALAEGFIKAEEQKSAALVEAGVEHKEAKPEPVTPDPALGALKQALTESQAQVAALDGKLAAFEKRWNEEQAAREKAALEPRGAQFFSGLPASRDPATALPDGVLPQVGPGQKAVNDPMIESLKAMGLVTLKQ